MVLGGTLVITIPMLMRTMNTGLEVITTAMHVYARPLEYYQYYQDMTISLETFRHCFSCVGVDTKFADIFRLNRTLSPEHPSGNVYLLRDGKLSLISTAYNGTSIRAFDVITIQSETDRVNDILKCYET